MLDEENRNFIQPERRRRTRNTHEKWNRILNYLIALVVLLIGVSVFVIWQTNDTVEQSAPEQTKEQLPSQTEEDVAVEESSKLHEQSEAVDEQVEEAQTDETSSEQAANEVVTKGSGNIEETWTNESWEAVPTAQTGAHRSVYEKGHIDYEEKLAAIFSILPIDRQTSVIWSVRNNGTAESARAIVSAKAQGQGYEVFIEWIDGVGWKPIQVNVLKEVKES